MGEIEEVCRVRCVYHSIENHTLETNILTHHLNGQQGIHSLNGNLTRQKPTRLRLNRNGRRPEQPHPGTLYRILDLYQSIFYLQKEDT